MRDWERVEFRLTMPALNRELRRSRPCETQCVLAAPVTVRATHDRPDAAAVDEPQLHHGLGRALRALSGSVNLPV